MLVLVLVVLAVSITPSEFTSGTVY